MTDEHEKKGFRYYCVCLKPSGQGSGIGGWGSRLFLRWFYFYCCFCYFCCFLLVVFSLSLSCVPSTFCLRTAFLCRQPFDLLSFVLYTQQHDRLLLLYTLCFVTFCPFYFSRVFFFWCATGICAFDKELPLLYVVYCFSSHRTPYTRSWPNLGSQMFPRPLFKLQR